MRTKTLGTLAAAAASAAMTAFWISRLPLLHFQDSIQYLSLAEHLARGEGYHSFFTLLPDLIHGPLYPLLVAAGIRWLHLRPLTAGMAVCAGAAGLTVFPLVRLHERAWGAARGWVVALLAGVSPALATFSSLTLEPLTCLLLALAAALAVAAAEGRSAPHALGAGACLGLGLLTRPEAVVTAGVLAGALLLWRGPLLGRLARAGALAAGALVVAVPYGMWLRSQLGSFELLPKARYNAHFPEIEARLRWPPEMASMPARDQRFQYALMPDHTELVKNHAFRHPVVDPRSMYPLGPPPPFSRQVARAAVDARAIVADGVRNTGLFHPATLLLLALSAGRALRRPGGCDRRVVALLFALVAAHLGPCILSAYDYQSRYVALSLAFALPLVAGGAVELAAAVSRRSRVPRRAALFAVVASVAALDVSLGLHLVSHTLEEGSAPRLEALAEACVRALPRGARVVAASARCAYLGGASVALALPYVETLGELGDYLRNTGADYLVLDARTLAKNPSRALRGLASRDAWPPGWAPVVELSPDSEPLRVVRVR